MSTKMFAGVDNHPCFFPILFDTWLFLHSYKQFEEKFLFHKTIFFVCHNNIHISPCWFTVHTSSVCCFFSCEYLHGLVCDLCGCECLHPYDIGQQEGNP